MEAAGEPLHAAGQLLVRLLAAAALGGVPGYERERSGKVAGLRTHMLVSLGAATFVVATGAAGASTQDLARVVQGIATGIGFIGAGAILKRAGEAEDVHGLTTAASIWMAASIGVSAGLGSLGVALVAALFAWVILSVLAHFEPGPRPGLGPKSAGSGGHGSARARHLRKPEAGRRLRSENVGRRRDLAARVARARRVRGPRGA
jgi:putative Mg2+ transporter-C (MgtC) family protein